MKCDTCDGTGHVYYQSDYRSLYATHDRQECPSCDGSGRIDDGEPDCEAYEYDQLETP